MIRFATLTATALLFAGTALAGTDVKVPAFTGINAHGGAGVVLRAGPVQRVTILEGDVSKADIHVRGNILDISPCKNWCWNVKELKVEVVTPRVESIEAHGGGAVRAEGQFAKMPRLTIEAHGGGAVNTVAIPADAVHVEAHGGGAVKVQALQSLDAEAHGGGVISYTGNPPTVRSESHGGGSIHRN